MAIVDGHICCSRCGEAKPLSDYQPSVDTIEGVRRALAYLERAQQPAPRALPAMRINLLKEAN